jgi:nitrogen regulatory protein PII
MRYFLRRSFESFQKLVTAIIKKFRLEENREALSAIGISGVAVTAATPPGC